MSTLHPVDPEILMAFLDAELPPAEATRVLGHLKTCAECQARVDEHRALSGRLAAWTVERAPAGLRQHDSWLRQLTFGMPRWALAGAAAALVLATGSIFVVKRAADAESPANSAHAFRGGVGGRIVAAPALSNEPVAESAKSSARQVAGKDTLLVIRTASITLTSDRFDDMRAAVDRLIAAEGGSIADLATASDAPNRRWLRATLRVPATRLDAALGALRTLGKVTDESVASEDVTAPYRDLTVRLAGARREEQRLGELLAKRTGTLADVLAVEKELARVRVEIERMEAEEKATSDQVALATIRLKIDEAYRADLGLGTAPLGTRLRNALVDGVRGAADGMVNMTLLLLRIAPALLLWAAILAWPAVRLIRRTRPGVAPKLPPPSRSR